MFGTAASWGLGSSCVQCPPCSGMGTLFPGPPCPPSWDWGCWIRTCCRNRCTSARIILRISGTSSTTSKWKSKVVGHDGSSETSCQICRYLCSRADSTVIRAEGSNASIRSRRSRASGLALAKRRWKGTLGIYGRFRTYSCARGDPIRDKVSSWGVPR